MRNGHKWPEKGKCINNRIFYLRGKLLNENFIRFY